MESHSAVYLKKLIDRHDIERRKFKQTHASTLPPPPSPQPLIHHGAVFLPGGHRAHGEVNTLLSGIWDRNAGAGDVG